MRQVLKTLVGTMLVFALGEGLVTPYRAVAANPSVAHSMTPIKAWQALKDGNARFVAGNTRHPHESTVWRIRQEEGQHPFATILGCSDSRVPPEVVFDVGLGDLFIIRVAGNVYDVDVAGSVEYAVEHLASPLVMVMGHTGCGAVTAAVEASDHAVNEPREIVALVHRILPAVPPSNPKTDAKTRLASAVEANVRRCVRQLSETPFLRRAVDAGHVMIVGAIYDLHTGEVRLLDGTHGDTME